MAKPVTLEQAIRPQASGVYVICSCCCRARATCQVLPRARLHGDSEYALNLAAAGRHKVVFLVLAMKFVNRVLLLLIC